MRALGIDVGGSGIKGALVDLETGRLLTRRYRIVTPASFGVQAVTDTIARVIDHFDFEGPVGVGFPAAVAGGVVLTPPTAHEVPGWEGESVRDLFSAATGRKVTVLNDADAAGLAEIRYGAGKGVEGVVITITLGTGVGGSLFMNGLLVPNLEIGKLYLRGQEEVCEQYMASRIRDELNLSWQEYGARLNEFCLHVEHLFSPGMIIIGGGISEDHENFLPGFPLKRTRLVAARMFNEAGIAGAAAWAAEAGS